MESTLFGKQINLKTHYCSLDGAPPDKVEVPYVNLYIQLRGCNAKCLFCEFQDAANEFDFVKFKLALRELSNSIKINKISITGGEPTLNLNRLYKIIDIVREICPECFFVMNTNGTAGSSPRYNVPLVTMYHDNMLEKFDSVSISRHHYVDEYNNEIFGHNRFKGDGISIISKQELKGIQSMVKNKDLFHLSCNLIKGYIDSTQKVYNYLEFASRVKINDVGFVSLMKINDF